MTECTQESLAFPPCKRRQVEARFDGGDITSDGGVLLLRQADRALGLSEALTSAMLERLLHHAHVIQIRGDSYRLRQARQSVLNTGKQAM